MIDFSTILNSDPELFASLQKELVRQRQHLELIASENFVSPAVMAVAGTHLTNKYAEGYSGKRYYGGCQFVDEAETLAIERVKALFGAEHANVQPHSGANANLSAFFALLNVGDKILGMSLAHGGHLTHGSPVNFSGKNYEIVPYYVSQESETIDYDEVERLAIEHKPKLVLAGASAYSRKIDFARFKQIADKVGAYLMVDMAHIAGLVVAGEHQNPVPYADIVTSTTHKTLRGPRGGLILCKKKHAKAVDKAVFPGTQGGPLMHIIAAKALAFKEASTPEFIEYQRNVIKNAKQLEITLKSRNIPLVSNGTDNHLLLLKLEQFDTTGLQIEQLLGQCNITINKNAIPFDKQSPFVTSGIRIGTPAVTTRGLNQEDMEQVAHMIADIIINKEQAVPAVCKKVEKICAKYPLYPDLVV